jgi:hypothetical protein
MQDLTIAELTEELDWAKRFKNTVTKLRKADRQYQVHIAYGLDEYDNGEPIKDATQVLIMVDESVHTDLGTPPPCAFPVLKDIPGAEE